MPFSLRSATVAALPIVNHFLSRLKVTELLSASLPPPDSRTRLDPAVTLGVLLRCLILSRNPLYSVSEWASPMLASLLGDSSPELKSLLNDDRIGRSLDRLFDADRNALLTEFVLRVIREFEVPLDQLHNDSTTLTFQGKYSEGDGRPVRGRPTLKITFGHNKDHRPDLKQLLWILTVTDEGVPVQFKVADGNTADVRTHVATWQSLCSLVGRPDFLYVADSKLCSRATLRLIQHNGGRFITVLPRTRKEDSRFRSWLTSSSPNWQEIARYPHPRLKDGPEDVVRALDSPFPDPDGYRLLWFHSTLKQDRDAENRQEALERAAEELQLLKTKVEGPRSRLSNRAAIAEKVEHVLEHRAVRRWIRYALEERRQERYRQEKRGRSGPQTRWRRTVKIRYTVSWQPILENIAEDAQSDGVFPLLTNCRDLSVKEVLEAYRRKQPLIEKRHEMLKTVLAATPMFLKNVARVEAFLFVEYLALTVHAVVERELRQAMARKKVKMLELYPEERECKAPTAARVFEVFETLQRHVLMDHDKVAQVFPPELTDLHAKVLGLLGVPARRFADDLR